MVLSNTDWQGISPMVMEANKDGSKMCPVTWLDLCFAKMAPNFSQHKQSQDDLVIIIATKVQNCFYYVVL